LDEIQSLAREQFCYLTTIGRVTGKPHTIEIWFAIEPEGRTLYMLSGGGDRADWVKNIGRNAQVEVRIRDRVFAGRGRVVPDGEEERLARRLIVAKYYGRDRVHKTGWEAESLPVAVDLAG
jgi:deazaflavin-dependent oxidoreductase (nitroreductase family)